MDQVEPQLLARLDEQGEIADTDELAQQLGVVHAALVPTIKSLDSYEMVRAQVRSHLDMQAHGIRVTCNIKRPDGHDGLQNPQEVKHSRLVLAADSRPYLDAGTPEAQVFRVLDDAGTPMSELKVRIQHVKSCHQLWWHWRLQRMYSQAARAGMSCGFCRAACRRALQT
jgi:PheRS DNA binding domain 1